MERVADVQEVADFLRLRHDWPKFPYPGLRPFKDTEAALFYGRKDQIDDILSRLNTSQLVFVSGPSGCGKSSLVKAGVIPGLSVGLLTHAGSRWRTVQTRPGRRPVFNLAMEFARAYGLDPSRDREIFESLTLVLEDGHLGLWAAIEMLRHRDRSAGERVLLIIDQFEEIFGEQIRDRAEVDAFVRLIVTEFMRPHPFLYVIVTVRSDYIGRCSNFPGLAEAINATQYLAPVLQPASLREAIVLPARDYGAAVAEDLVTDLLTDMKTGTSYDADNLPLMQHALLWLWQDACREANLQAPPTPEVEYAQPVFHVRATAYRQNGGMRGILNKHADEILRRAAGHDGSHARHAEVIFRRLSERDELGRYRRSPASTRELAGLASCSEGELKEVVEPFEEVSFLESRASQSAGETLLDLAHESLIRKWIKARCWADAEAEKLRSFRDLLRTAQYWASNREPQELLKRGGELEFLERWWRTEVPTEAWARRYFTSEAEGSDASSVLSLTEHFMRQSKRRNDQEVAEIDAIRRENEQRRQEAERQRQKAELMRSNRQRDRALAGAAVVVGLLVGSLFFGITAKRSEVAAQAANLRLHAEKIAIRAEDVLQLENPAKAILIALQIQQKNLPSIPEAERVLYESLRLLRERRVIGPYERAVMGVSFGPKGNVIAVAEQERVSFLVPSNGQVIDAYDLPVQAGFGLQWSSEGEQLALSTRDQAILLTPCSRPKLRPYFVACAQRDTDIMLKVGGADRRAGPAKFSRDGKWIVTGNWGARVKTWSTSTGEELRDFGVEVAFPNAVGVSADMRHVGAGLQDGSIRIFDAQTGEQRRELKGPPAAGSIVSLEFDRQNPDLFAASTQSGSILLGNTGTGSLVPLPATRGLTFQLAFSEDGQSLVAGSDDAGLRLWSVSQPTRAPFLLRAHTGPVYYVRFSPDGLSIISGSADKTVRIWSRYGPLRPERVQAIKGSGKTVQEVKPFTERLDASDRYRNPISGDVHANGQVVLATATGGLALYSPDRAERLVELGNWDRWSSVRFEANPDRIVAKSDAATYSWPFFRDFTALADFAAKQLPFHGQERIKLSAQEACRAGTERTGCSEDANAANQMSQ